jgi:hypothetical protein
MVMNTVNTFIETSKARSSSLTRSDTNFPTVHINVCKYVSENDIGFAKMYVCVYVCEVSM